MEGNFQISMENSWSHKNEISCFILGVQQPTFNCSSTEKPKYLFASSATTGSNSTTCKFQEVWSPHSIICWRWKFLYFSVTSISTKGRHPRRNIGKQPAPRPITVVLTCKMQIGRKVQKLLHKHKKLRTNYKTTKMVQLRRSTTWKTNPNRKHKTYFFSGCRSSTKNRCN
jgi:hypothetical protein